MYKVAAHRIATRSHRLEHDQRLMKVPTFWSDSPSGKASRSHSRTFYPLAFTPCAGVAKSQLKPSQNPKNTPPYPHPTPPKERKKERKTARTTCKKPNSGVDPSCGWVFWGRWGRSEDGNPNLCFELEQTNTGKRRGAEAEWLGREGEKTKERWCWGALATALRCSYARCLCHLSG